MNAFERLAAATDRVNDAKDGEDIARERLRAAIGEADQAAAALGAATVRRMRAEDAYIDAQDAYIEASE